MSTIPQSIEGVLPSPEPRTRAGVRALWAAFLRAAIEPSLPALAGTVAIAVLLFAVCAARITPELMAGKAVRYIAQGPTDDYAFVSGDAIRARASATARPVVAVFGASALRESISHEDHLRDAVAARLGRPVAVQNLTTSAQSVWETAALSDYLAERFDGTVVIGVAPYLLSATTADLTDLARHPRLGITSASFDDEAARVGVPAPWRSSNYFFDNREFFFARMPMLALHLATGPVSRSRGRYLGRSPVRQNTWDDMAEKIQKRLEHYGDNADRNLAVLERTIARLRGRGHVSVALVELTTNPRAVGTVIDERLRREHRARVEQFARAHRVEYWTLDDAAGLTEADYYDWCHLNNAAAQRRYTDVLAGRVAQLLDSAAGVRPAGTGGSR